MISFRMDFVLLALVAVCSLNMGEGSKQGSVMLEPQFMPLEEGEGSVLATVHDETSAIKIKDASFFGRVLVGGIRSEINDSILSFDLSNIKELVVIKPHYDSKRFSDKEFTLAKVTTANGKTIDNLLVPPHIVICGIEVATGLERAWFLSKIDKIVIDLLADEASPKMADEKTASKVSSVDTTKKETLKKEQMPVAHHQEDKPKGIIESFLGILDSLYDFFMAFIRGIFGLFR